MGGESGRRFEGEKGKILRSVNGVWGIEMIKEDGLWIDMHGR